MTKMVNSNCLKTGCIAFQCRL